ncbi:uncharacterized protein LOC101850865 [Aplysia californica]|uniref:Uncharacterized protein LOC101850865 n=1 Tax=Aplysia californica TaxID=6500 RepID=A0ABM0JDN7_APLCA|nr:uncharacterized protein LOC101850865 [Aplysia californica]
MTRNYKCNGRNSVVGRNQESIKQSCSFTATMKFLKMSSQSGFSSVEVRVVLCFLCTCKLNHVFGQTISITGVAFKRRNVANFGFDTILKSINNVRSGIECALLCTKLSGCSGYEYRSPSRECLLGQGLQPGSGSASNDARLFVTNTDWLTCSSQDHAYVECAHAMPIMWVSVKDKHSSAVCTRDDSFGLTTGGVLWVDNGCRATFKITTSW